MSSDYSIILDSLNKDPYLAYYVLGAFVTDGSVRIKAGPDATECELSSRDIDWLELINQKLGGTTKVIPKDNGARIRFWNKEIFDWLISHGCPTNKSLNVEFPNIPPEYLRDFLRGCMDGDGSISFTQYTKKLKNGHGTYWKLNSYICSSSLPFIQGVEKVLQNKNIKYSFVLKKNTKSQKIKYKNQHYRVVMNDSRAKEFLEWIYYDGNTISMPRKSALVKSVIKTLSND